ncbi:MAG: phosphate starvation-inducible protein PhoH [endosymbiont of Galathealinum brachiosum]|uniref:PhoH-like protein n=1 Tax=endosymbiont of Galathealinum brachiosum TaxID=2200906 RepID=A0A370DJD3_9GAMM|nr:MAG: phosphate starvation-inducible protein PhoH [endosymbiont of Galathealinum brachiosum]
MAESLDIEFEPADNQRLANLCGPMNEHLQQIERRLGVEINNRNHHFQLIGDSGDVKIGADILKDLYLFTKDQQLTANHVHLQLQESGFQEMDEELMLDANQWNIRLRKEQIRGRGLNQVAYLKSIQTHDLSFGIGPAGTGKTYLAVACAVAALESETVQRLLLVRPAVEAGERLGFLPGDLAQKIDPYLRPMYDALYEMMGFERVAKLIERNIIEIAPLAYMRGRTLNDAFIILDEAQNTTREQMKMFLTRIGFGSTAVITGDVTQIDLPRGTYSGLRHAIDVLNGIDDISMTFFKARDVVRHPMVKRIVKAYDAHEARVQDENNSIKQNQERK